MLNQVVFLCYSSQWSQKNITIFVIADRLLEDIMATLNLFHEIETMKMLPGQI